MSGDVVTTSLLADVGPDEEWVGVSLSQGDEVDEWVEVSLSQSLQDTVQLLDKALLDYAKSGSILSLEELLKSTPKEFLTKELLGKVLTEAINSSHVSAAVLLYSYMGEQQQKQYGEAMAQLLDKALLDYAKSGSILSLEELLISTPKEFLTDGLLKKAFEAAFNKSHEQAALLLCSYMSKEQQDKYVQTASKGLFRHLFEGGYLRDYYGKDGAKAIGEMLFALKESGASYLSSLPLERLNAFFYGCPPVVVVIDSSVVLADEHDAGAWVQL
jgi:hypothetical protein